MGHTLLKSMLLPGMLASITLAAGLVATIPVTHADENDEIVITVDSACTMGQTVTTAHNTTLNPGETSSTIGQSRIAAYCNDLEGYAIYAIGYTNGEYGNTNLESADGNHTIATGTSGTNSYWNMQLTPATSGSYIPNIVSPFNTNTTIPEDYTKVAYRDSITPGQTVDPTTSGSYFTTTYQAHISTTQPAGVYNGQVQYVMVHPSTAPAPEKPIFMQDTATIKAKLTNYGDTIQATDKRDGKKYWITKLADGNIWMTQNLDFDIVNGGADLDSTNTDIPANWTDAGNLTNTYNDTTWNSSTITPESYDPGNLYWNGELNENGDGTLDNMTSSTGDSHYHIGNYYNWTAAVAMGNSSSYTTDEQDVNQSICPAGWRLPTYSGDKSYNSLVSAQSLTAGADGNIQNSPTYFVYSGGWGGSFYFVGSSGYYWSRVVDNGVAAYLLYFYAGGGVGPLGVFGRSYGLSLRCVAR